MAIPVQWLGTKPMSQQMYYTSISEIKLKPEKEIATARELRAYMCIIALSIEIPK